MNEFQTLAVGIQGPKGEFLDFDYQFYRIKTLLGRKIDALAKDVAEFYAINVAKGYQPVNKWPVSNSEL